MAFERIVSLIEVKDKLDDNRVTVVDVHEPAEYAFGHVPGAVSIPLGEWKVRKSQV